MAYTSGGVPSDRSAATASREICGILALDLDGTALSSDGTIARELGGLLNKLHREGWELLFATGRAKGYAMRAVSSLAFPVYLALYNGAQLMDAKSGESLYELHLDHAFIKKALQLAEGYGCRAYTLYPGMSGEDLVFYSVERFSSEELDYLKKRSAAYQEVLLPGDEASAPWFAAMKWLKAAPGLEAFAAQLQEELPCTAPVIRDPFANRRQVLQMTHRSANKGQSLKALRDHLTLSGRVTAPLKTIAAGDDLNDLSLFAAADLSIAMEVAPPTVLQAATFISRREEGGLIGSIMRAVDLCRR